MLHHDKTHVLSLGQHSAPLCKPCQGAESQCSEVAFVVPKPMTRKDTQPGWTKLHL